MVIECENKNSCFVARQEQFKQILSALLAPLSPLLCTVSQLSSNQTCPLAEVPAQPQRATLSSTRRTTPLRQHSFLFFFWSCHSASWNPCPLQWKGRVLNHWTARSPTFLLNLVRAKMTHDR